MDSYTQYCGEIDFAFNHYKDLYLSQRPTDDNPFDLDRGFKFMDFHSKFYTVSDYLLVRAKASGVEKSILKRLDKYTAKKGQEFYLLQL